MSDTPTLRLQHLAIEVADVDRSIEFYRQYLGMKLSERHAPHEVEAIPVELCFLRLGVEHHVLNLVHNPNKRYTPKPKTPADDPDGPPSIHHFAFECPDLDAWLAMRDKANEMNLEIIRGPVVHSPWDPRGDGSWGENESFYVLRHPRPRINGPKGSFKSSNARMG